MALSHSPEWAKQADAATERRDRKNIPWLSCTVKDCKGSANPRIGLCFQHFLRRNINSSI